MAKTPDDQRLELLQGTLDMLILRTLQWGPQHGHGIGQSIRTQSDDLLKVETGSLYPALHRLVKRGWLQGRVGRQRGQPAGQVLPPHRRGQGAAAARTRSLVAARARDRPRDESRAGARGLTSDSFLAEATRSISTKRTSRTRSAPTSRSPTGEKMADGADRQTARYAALQEFGNVTLTTEATRRVWTPWWLDALHDLLSDVRYAFGALAKNPRVLADGHRRPRARHRPERRGLHDGQEHGAQPDRRRRRIGASGRGLRRTEHRPRGARVVPRLSPPARSRHAFAELFGSGLVDRRPGPGPQRPRSLERAGHRQLLPDPRRPRRAAAARCCRRTKSLRAVIRSSSSATASGGATSPPIRTSSARPSRSTTIR